MLLINLLVSLRCIILTANVLIIAVRIILYADIYLFIQNIFNTLNSSG